MTLADQSALRRIAYLERRINELEMELRRVGKPPKQTLQLNGRLWRFELNEAFTNGSAGADLKHFDGTDTLLDVTVKDPLLIFQTLGVQAGDEGYCVEQLDLDGTRFFIVVQMECP